MSVRLYDERVRKATFAVTIRDKKTGEPVARRTLMLSRGSQGTFDADIRCGRVIPWHFDHPALYDFEVSVMEGKSAGDICSGYIGFRTFRIEGNRFVLNGEPVRLPGIETMPGSNPDYGMAEPLEYIHATASMLKDLNATIIRFHWVQGDDIARLPRHTRPGRSVVVANAVQDIITISSDAGGGDVSGAYRSPLQSSVYLCLGGK